MRKQLLSLKFIAEKLHKSLSTPTNFHYSNPFHSISNPINNNGSHLLNSHPSSLLSPYHQWRSSTINGFLKNPVLSKHFVSRAQFKGSIKSFLGSRVGFLTTHFSKIKGPIQQRGWSSWTPGYSGYSSDSVVYGLIFANAAIFLLWRVLPRDFMFRNFTISVDNIKSGRIHTLLTSAFSHINMEHIGSNMLGLYFFGSSIGSVFGPEYLPVPSLLSLLRQKISRISKHCFLTFKANHNSFHRQHNSISSYKYHTPNYAFNTQTTLLKFMCVIKPNSDVQICSPGIRLFRTQSSRNHSRLAVLAPKKIDVLQTLSKAQSLAEEKIS